MIGRTKELTSYKFFHYGCNRKSEIPCLIKLFAGAEVAVLCITKAGEVVNYQAFTDSKGIYTVAETMSESERWDACLVRPISSFHERCNHLRDGSSGVKFTYKRRSGHAYTLKPFVYRFANAPMYC